MEDKVLCPWCGSEMGLCTEHKFPNQLYFAAHYICRECGATSPQRVHYTDRESAKEFAKEAALKRFKPLQKPLPWAEVIERGKHPNSIVWIETGMMLSSYIQSGWYELLSVSRADSDGRYHFTGKIELYRPGFHDPYILSILLYEKEVRCWATKPTDEERRTVKWEK